MNSSGKNIRSNKGTKGGSVRSNGTPTGSNDQTVKSEHNHPDKETKPATAHKITPTAEQMRIAHMFETTTTEHALQEKISQVTQITGVSTDDAIVALHDCNNDVTAAIDALLEGDDQGEWKESTKKKKKPAAKGKSKDETESNKENRRMDTRDRTASRSRGGASRFRGAARGGRGGREESGDSSSWARKDRQAPRMTNGTNLSFRGRGARGRGSASFRGFSSRAPSFPDAIDTWGAPQQLVEVASDLQIDTWDVEPSVSTEDWDNEWTGSLDTTTVFGQSASLPASTVNPAESSNTTHTVPGMGNNVAGGHSLNESASSQSPQDGHASSSPRDANLSDSMSPIVGRNQRLAAAGSASKSYGSAVSNSASSMSPSRAMDLAALLQKAAPHSTLGRLAPSAVDSTSMQSGSNSQNNILMGMTGGDDAMKASYVSVGQSVPSSSKGYVSSSVTSNSMFSNSALGPSLGPNSMASRSKQPARRVPQPPSKIPSSAVEMPENTMSALELQFTGLEFGTETFDFTDVKSSMSGNNLVSGNAIPSRDGTTAPNVGKDHTSLNSMPQQQTLVPEPIPFPTQSSDRKPSSGNMLSSQRAAASSSANPSYADLKKDNSNSLGALVGSSPVPTSPYQNSGSFASKTSSSFPSPPSAHFAQNSSQPIQSSYDTTAGGASSLSGPMPTSASAAPTAGTLNSAQSSGPASKTSGPSKNVSSVGSVPPGVQHLPSQSQMMQHQLSQSHQLQQIQQMAQTQSPQNQQMMAGPAPSQYVAPPAAALQQNIPPTFYNVQQPAMYSYEDLQMFQQRIPHMQQAPTTLPTARDGSITSPAVYSGTDAGKFRNDQNSSPVPSTINQPGAPGATFITAAGNAGIPPYFMYHHNMAVQNSYPQYGHPHLIQLPANSHTGTSSTQFPGPPKLPYGGTSTYYDGIGQQSDYSKGGYGSASQGQSKSGANSSASGNNAAADLSAYKNHLNKVGRSYDKQSFHSGTPPPFNLAASAGSNPMTANAYGPAMFFSPVPPATAQHHSPLVHHQLHQQDGGVTGNSQRSGVGGSNPNKGASKGASYGSYWGGN